MRNGLAEWVISRGAGPEQAATILGDLLEEQLEPMAFWLAVLRATVSIARHQPPKRLLLNFLWFTYELSFYAFLRWWLIALERTHSFRMFSMDLILVSAPWLAFSFLWARKKNSSVVISTAFYIWLLIHDGIPVWLVLLTALPAIPYGWWRQWRRSQKNASLDQPAIG